MCALKEETKSKLERLIDALDRHSSLLERLLTRNSPEVSFERDRNASGCAGTDGPIVG